MGELLRCSRPSSCLFNVRDESADFLAYGDEVGGLVWNHTFGSKSEDSPATIAEANSSDFLEAQLLLECFGGSFNLRLADVFVVSANEAHDVEGVALLWVFEGFWGHYLAAETACWS